MKGETVYVVGHRNPDTDSICSAISLAHLRRLQGQSNIFASRAGNLNRQTEFVLEEFGVPAPPLLLDVFPRVRDVIGSQVVTISGNAPLAQALELYHRHNIRILPVVDEENHPLGILALKKVAERLLVPSQEEEIRRVLASPESIRQCLKATSLNMVDGESIEEMDLYVGAMAAATFHEKMKSMDPRRTILVTGDREKIQWEGVKSGVRVLIATGSLPVDPAILSRGRDEGVTILSTPFDTATSAWLTRLSTPVRRIAAMQYQAVAMQERLDELRLKLLHSKEPGAVVLDGEGRVAGVVTKSNLLAPSRIKLILVDHNELSQAVPGAEKVEILEVIDHHRLGNFQTDQPIRFINQPLGSTCTLVAGLYRQEGITPDPVMAGVMLGGLLSDTVILKSPTTTDTDRETAAWLGDIAGRDPQQFGTRIFAAGSTLAAYASIRDIILADFKEYTVNDRSFGVGQVEVVSFHEFHGKKAEIAADLALLRKEKGLDLAGLLVTDIVQETSLLLAAGGRELPYLIGYPQVDENLFELKGVLSRKKQLVPHLLKVLKQ
jgi:manganese-dependent inorganic pyrophosphatase